MLIRRYQARGPHRAAVAIAIAAGALSALAPAVARAQPASPSGWFGSATVTALTEFRTDLDDGGDFSWSGVLANGSLGWRANPRFAGALTLRYAYEDWDFSTPNALYAQAPWGSVTAAGVGLNLTYTPAPDLTVLLLPQVQWNYESGASTGDAQSYGAILAATKAFSPTLMLGAGVGVFRQIDRTRVIPIILVNWRITDKWRLSNPLQAGPAGGPGLELSYAFADGWELAGGASYRDVRFRLRDDGPSPNGIGQTKGAPVFLHLSRKFGPQGSIDLYAGAVVGGSLRVLDRNGSTISSSDFKPAPLLAISGSLSFR